MVTKAVQNPGNFTIGPSYIYVGSYGDVKADARDLGITQGGVSYNHTSEFKEYDDADQYIGVVGVEKIGDRLEVTVRAKEAILENLALAWGLPDSNLSEETNTLSFGGDYNAVYRSLFIDGPAPGGGIANWELYKVVAYTSGEITDQKDDNTIYEITFLVIEDVTKAEHQRYGQRVDTYDDVTGPSVSTVSPVDSAIDVAATTTVSWQFDEAIQQRDITSANFNVLDDTGVEVAGSLSYDETLNEVVFTPASDLTAETTYFTFASGAVKDMAGNAMDSNSRTSFTTIV
jgi:hypothetical protein